MFRLLGLVTAVSTFVPDLSNITYLHNISLTYTNGSLQGLQGISNLTGVDQEMAESLKEAIEAAMPGFLNETETTVSEYVGTTSESISLNSAELSISTQSTNAITTTATPARVRRQAGTTPTDAEGSGEDTYQPYGTDEEFYERPDLVHFYVNITLPDGVSTTNISDALTKEIDS